MKPQVFVSIDIEADGPCPGPNAMLSVGAAAFTLASRTPIAAFEMNLEPIPGSKPNEDTMLWWARHPEAYAYATKNPVPAKDAMRFLALWCETLPSKPVLLTYPSWDIMWMTWYFNYAGLKNPFGLAGLDLKSFLFGTGLVSQTFVENAKKRMPEWFFEGAPKHTHRAIDDAIEQGVIFVNACEGISHGVWRG